MFNSFPPRAAVGLISALVFFSLSAWALVSPARATTHPTGSASFKPDASFLKEEPYRKTKQLVQLTGVKSEAEYAVVKQSMNEVVRFVRLFGISGSNLGNAVISGTSPERMAEIKAAKVTWRAYENLSTPKGRDSMPIEPASGHMVRSMGDWEVESDTALSVRVDFRVTFVELKPVKDPAPQVMRLRFVKQEGKWVFDGATKL